MADIKRAALIISIAIFFSFLVVLGTDLFLSEPTYEKYCAPQRPAPYLSQPKADGAYAPGNCIAISPSPAQEVDCQASGGYFEYSYAENASCPASYSCNTCQVGLEAARKSYNLVFFIVAVIFGSAALIFGVLAPERIDSIGTGFMYGGIILMAYGTLRYADLSNKFVRFLAIFLELALVVWATYMKIEKAKERATGKGKKPAGKRVP